MKKSHESAEDYLENILILRERNGNVRSIDIVNEMNYSKPSISIAMKKLRSEGLVEMDLNGYITLSNMISTMTPMTRSMLFIRNSLAAINESPVRSSRHVKGGRFGYDTERTAY